MYKVFIDGSAGTTGLDVFKRLSPRKDIKLTTLPEELRKDISARKDALNGADLVFLCLPDAAAEEAVSLIENESVKVIDTSTAHRVKEGWTYGFPEIGGRREEIEISKRVANPGCHASGFIALIQPLVAAGLVDKTERLSCFSITGYTGGGKKMIAEYESETKEKLLDAPRVYGISENHKHLPEMTFISGLTYSPIFCPVVAPFPRGMEIIIPLFKNRVHGSVNDVKEAYRAAFRGNVVRFTENADEAGFVSAAKMAGKDSMEISVFGNEEKILLVSRFDNLGKGACGAAIQNMNLILGEEETLGLSL